MSSDLQIAGSTLLYTRYDLETACERLADLGFSSVDVATCQGWAHVDPSEMIGAVEEAIDRIEAACRTAGLDPVAFNANVGSADVDLDEQCRRLDALAAVAEGVGVDAVTLPAAAEGTDLEADLERFDRFVDRVEDRDFALTIEAHYGQHTADPAVARRYLDAVDGLGLTLDPSHFAVGPDWNGGGAYAPLLDRVEHVHLRQSGDSWDDVQIAPDAPDGRIEFDSLLSDLREAKYDGTLSVEYVDSLDGVDPDEAERHAEELFRTLRDGP